MKEENLKGMLGRYADKELTTMRLRDLHSALTDYLGKRKTKEEFAIAFIYKNWIEDLLKNLFEDDYVNNPKAKKIIDKLRSSIGYFSAHEEDKKGWLEEIFKFADEYRELPSLRYPDSEIFVKGPNEEEAKLFVADFGEDKIFAGDDFENIFPILDSNLTDPYFSKPICDWYLNTISELKENGEINSLCFIEKEYSAVGGLAMLSQLVYKLELPSFIFRTSYWNKRAKIDGVMPTPEFKICVVFDVVYSGRMLSNVAQFLRENFGAETKAAVVFFNFGKEKECLKGENIDLSSYLCYSDIHEQIKADLPLLKRSRARKNEIFSRSNFAENEMKVKEFVLNREKTVEGDILLDQSMGPK
jgi:hypothetical protein